MREGAGERTYINEFGFFFFLRMAVAVSSTCGGLVEGVASAGGATYILVLGARWVSAGC